MIFIFFLNGFMNIYVFDLKIVFKALEKLCGALLGYFELHFGSQEAPWGPFGGCQRLLGAHNQSTGYMDRDFGALGNILELSWSPLGVPETSRAPKSDAKSLFDANLSVK